MIRKLEIMIEDLRAQRLGLEALAVDDAGAGLVVFLL
jgi:hypothetical protein